MRNESPLTGKVVEKTPHLVFASLAALAGFLYLVDIIFARPDEEAVTPPKTQQTRRVDSFCPLGVGVIMDSGINNTHPELRGGVQVMVPNRSPNAELAALCK